MAALERPGTLDRYISSDIIYRPGIFHVQKNLHETTASGVDRGKDIDANCKRVLAPTIAMVLFLKLDQTVRTKSYVGTLD